MEKNFTLYQFNALPELQKINLLETDGVFLDASVMDGVYKIGLFSLAGFYVEVYYHIRTDTIAKLNAFISLKRLETYLPAVNITGALTCL